MKSALLTVLVFAILLSCKSQAQIDTTERYKYEKRLYMHGQGGTPQQRLLEFVSQDTAAGKITATHFIPISLSESVIFNTLACIEMRAYYPNFVGTTSMFSSDSSVPLNMWQYYFVNRDRYYIVEEWKFMDTNKAQRFANYLSSSYTPPQEGSAERNPKPLCTNKGRYLYIMSSPIINYDPDTLDKYWKKLVAR